MDGRHAADSQVDGFFSDLHLDASVLGNALFRDVHRTGHDLEAADDGSLEFLGRVLDFLEVSVDPEPDPQAFFQGFDVDVTGPAVLRLDKDVGDHPDDRCIIPCVGLILLVDGNGTGQILQTGRIQSLDFLGDLRGDGADKLHGAFEQEPEAVKCLEIHRVGDRQHQRSVMFRDGNRLVPAGGFGGELGNEFRAGGHLVQVDKVHAVLGGESPGNILLADGSLPDQGVDHVCPTGATGDFLRLLLAQQADILEDLDHIFVVGGHCSGGSVAWLRR